MQVCSASIRNSWLGIKQFSKVWLLKLQYGVCKSFRISERAGAQLHKTHDRLSLDVQPGPPIPETPGPLACDRNTPLFVSTAFSKCCFADWH